MIAKVADALAPLNIPVLYGNRGEDYKEFPLIVYNILETPVDVMDDINIWTCYDVYLNVYVSSYELTELITNVKKLMIANGFRLKPNSVSMFDDKYSVFNQSLRFQIHAEQDFGA